MARVINRYETTHRSTCSHCRKLIEFDLITDTFPITPYIGRAEAYVECPSCKFPMNVSSIAYSNLTNDQIEKIMIR